MIYKLWNFTSFIGNFLNVRINDVFQSANLNKKHCKENLESNNQITTFLMINHLTTASVLMICYHIDSFYFYFLFDDFFPIAVKQ